MSDRRYEYIARTVPFEEMEEFLNEHAERGYMVVSQFPATMTISENEQTGKDGHVATMVYNVTMARYVGPGVNGMYSQ